VAGKALDLTREELAKRVGCSVSAIRKIETDERRPSKQLAGILADCLEISLKDRPSFLKIARGERLREQIHSSIPHTLLQPIQEEPSTEPCTHLPSPPTPLVGREEELSTLGQLVTDSRCRIITLVGPGGIGKTRLAIQVAEDQCQKFSDGAFFAGLSGINDLDHVIPAIAEAIKFSFFGAIDPKTQLLNYLKVKKLLLVLDNFEQLVQGAWLVVEIVENSPDVKLLITSREQLNVSGEWTFEVNGLAYPSTSDPLLPNQESSEVHTIEDYSAVALFSQSASRARVGNKIEAADYPASEQLQLACLHPTVQETVEQPSPAHASHTPFLEAYWHRGNRKEQVVSLHHCIHLRKAEPGVFIFSQFIVACVDGNTE
jgi:transcriptional regulator with XRE-family HTH domain